MAYQERCCECSFWVKYCLFTINFLVWAGGVTLIVIGGWARIQKEQLSSVDSLTADPALMLVVVGVIMFVTSIFGCIGSVRENICLLKIYVVVIILVFVLEIIAGILAFVFMDRVQESLLTFMKTAIVTFQEDLDLQNTMDYIQRRYQCCGGASYNDWEMNRYYNCSSPTQYRCGVPMSCCRLRTSIQCGFGARLNGEELAGLAIYTEGCLDTLMTLFKDNLFIVGVIAFTVGIIELIAIILAHVLIKYIVFGFLDYNSPSKQLTPSTVAVKQYAATDQSDTSTLPTTDL